MTGVSFAVITFVCTFGGALLGMIMRTRLPPAHLIKESDDVIQRGMGLVATMTALLLGLVTAAAKGSFDSMDVAVQSTAAAILTLDRHLARYGPETAPTRELIRRGTAFTIEAIWPSSGAPGSPVRLDASPMAERSAAEEVENQILRLSPETDAQRWLKSEALKVTDEVFRTRSRLLGSAGGGAVQRTFLTVVIFWLSMAFASFGLGTPRNATVVTALGISALSVAAAVFLIFELDRPFEGIIRISSGPFRYALANLGR